MSLKILQLDFAKFGFVPFCFFVHEAKKRYLLANLGLAKPWKWRNVTWKKGTILKRMVNHLRNHHFFLGGKMWNGLLKKYVKLYFYRLPCLKAQPEGLPTWISQQGSLYYQAKQCISKKGNPWKTTIDSSKFDFPPPKRVPRTFFDRIVKFLFTMPKGAQCLYHRALQKGSICGWPCTLPGCQWKMKVKHKNNITLFQRKP